LNKKLGLAGGLALTYRQASASLDLSLRFPGSAVCYNTLWFQTPTEPECASPQNAMLGFWISAHLVSGWVGCTQYPAVANFHPITHKPS